MENAGQGKLFVFIGEKIELKELTDEKDIMDAKFLAKYKILEKVCGDYRKDTVEFIVYDHYGNPAFEKYKTVMLYLSEYEGVYYHEKYQYHDLYKTKDGKWASPYDWLDNSRADTSNNPVKPVIINFAEEVSYSIAGLKKRDIKRIFPEPFYKVVDSKAVAVFGNYVPELFELKKRGVLAARGLFGKPDTSEIREVELEEMEQIKQVHIPGKDKMALLSTWYKFLNAIEAKNSQKIKALSLDSVACSVCEGFASPDFYNDVEPIDTFISASYINFPNTELWKNMKRNRPKITATKHPNLKPAHFQLHNNESLIIYNLITEVALKYGKHKYQQRHTFQFVKIDGEFRFYGMESL